MYSITLQNWFVFERSAFYRSYSKIRVICDACCRVPEYKQDIPQHRARGKSACGYVFVNSNEKIISQKAKYLGDLTVDQAEYQALIFALNNASGFCRQEVEVWMDNEIAVGQLSGFYCLRAERIKPLFDEVKKLEMRFKKVVYFHHSRGSFWARAADKLANEEYSRLQKG
jgi:ribonuclease HI